jgi:hypothetical protein
MSIEHRLFHGDNGSEKMGKTSLDRGDFLLGRAGMLSLSRLQE